MRNLGSIAMCVCVVLVCVGTSLAVPFSDIVVFGDSLSDVGNIYAASSSVSWLIGDPQPAPPYVAGRFTNGPVWVDHLGAVLGHSAVSTPSYVGGNNYAFGGALTDIHDYAVEEQLGPLASLGRFGVQSQMGMYYNDGGNDPDGTKLHVLWAGANDFFNDQTNAMVPALNMAINVAWLYQYTGARHFLVPNLPPLGLTPRYISSAKEAQMNQLSREFNDYLAFYLDFLEANLAGLETYRPDIYTGYEYLLDNPAEYGLTNTSGKAYSGTTVVPNPEEYLFWDDVHPTARAHELIAIMAVLALPPDSIPGMDLASLAIPEPATLLLLATATLLGLRRRQR